VKTVNNETQLYQRETLLSIYLEQLDIIDNEFKNYYVKTDDLDRYLNEQALNVFDNEINIDFLVDNFDDEVGISIDMFDFDLNEEITHLETRYYEEDYINIGGFDVTLDDILVKKPKKRRKNIE